MAGKNSKVFRMGYWQLGIQDRIETVRYLGKDRSSRIFRIG
jgi:hypothetical protein